MPYGLCVLGFFLVTAGWALANPLLSGPDEPTQIIHAEAVARGQIVGTPVRQGHDPGLPQQTSGDPNVYVHVPGVLQRVNEFAYWCFIFHVDQTPGCAPRLVGPAGDVTMETYVGRYPPLYYLAVSTPSLLDSGRPGILGMRTLSALWNSLLLAAAFAIALRRSRVAALGVLVAATPTVMYYAGSINPNGLEMSAAICTWCALCELALPGDRPPPTWLITVAALAASVLALSRGLSPVWLAFIVAVVALACDPRRLGALRHRRAAQVGGAVTLLVVLAAGGWILGEHALYELSYALPSRYGDGWLLRKAVDLTPHYLQEMLGLFGANNIPAPPFTMVAFIAALAVLVVTALVRSSARARSALALIAVAIVVVPIAADFEGARSYGFIWQGRYTMAIGVGLPILAAQLVCRPARGRPVPRWLTTAAIVGAFALALGQVLALWWDLRRFMVGANGSIFGIFHGVWRPDVPAPLLVLGAVVGSFGLAAAVLAAPDAAAFDLVPAEGPAPPDGDGADGADPGDAAAGDAATGRADGPFDAGATAGAAGIPSSMRFNGFRWRLLQLSHG